MGQMEGIAQPQVIGDKIIESNLTCRGESDRLHDSTQLLHLRRSKEPCVDESLTSGSQSAGGTAIEGGNQVVQASNLHSAAKCADVGARKNISTGAVAGEIGYKDVASANTGRNRQSGRQSTVDTRDQAQPQAAHKLKRAREREHVSAIQSVWPKVVQRIDVVASVLTENDILVWFCGVEP